MVGRSSNRDGAAVTSAAADEALSGLCEALLAVAPLVAATEAVVRVAGAEPRAVPALERLVGGLTSRLGLPRLEFTPTREGLCAADLAVSHRLALDRAPKDAERLVASPAPELDRAVAAARAAEPLQGRLHSPDGAPLRCYSAGRRDRPAVVLASACGMPVGLVRPWIRRLSSDFHVLTWESRGLFGADDHFDGRSHEVVAQARDLLAVMEVNGVDRAHVMGLCGGAAIALAAAASSAVASLSLWFGDYELGGEAPKTSHQQDVQAMLAMAGRSRARAGSLQKLFRRPAVLDRLRLDVAHYLLYPYANAELLYRYARLNGAIMTTDCRPFVQAVDKPTLVVTSPDDRTAHPHGSLRVARDLRGARLETVSSDGHLSVFDAPRRMADLARSFISATLP